MTFDRFLANDRGSMLLHCLITWIHGGHVAQFWSRVRLQSGATGWLRLQQGKFFIFTRFFNLLQTIGS